MTIQECYEKIGDYPDALCRLMDEKRIARLVGKFPADSSYSNLCRFLKEEDYQGAFRMAHTLKGVAANLSLTRVAEKAGVVTDVLRDRQPHDVSSEMKELTEAYELTVEAIRAYQESNS